MILSLLIAAAAVAPTQTPDAGNLIATGKDGKALLECPLERTSVNANLAGFGARVTVVQTFKNPSKTPIEAIYTFPLPADAAVDRMRIEVGKRIIEGVIKRREEAERIYAAARSQGQTAALLNQERPNIFTQNVANIMPGEQVRVEISYSEILPYEHGQIEFNFPMVVGPRYLGNAADPGKIAPPITPEGTRTGANIDLTVNLQAGAPIEALDSVLHKVDVQKVSNSAAIVKLAKRDEIPNRDFILRYKVATDQIQSSFLTHTDPQKGGFFSLILLPPTVPVSKQIAPRELIFVMDQSGSQSGFPIEKSKELTLKLIHAMRPGDTFNVLAFSNDVRSLWQHSKPNNAENLAEAEKFIKPMTADGGTELRKAVCAALDAPDDPGRLRLVVFNTDGYVGDEKQILDSVQKHRRNSRMFTFGIGNSVNHFLIDAMSQEGKGDSETVTLAESADPAVQRFLDRTQSPVLTDIHASIDGVPTSDLLPAQIPDVFAGRPVVLYGRYAGSGPARVTITGKLGGQPWSQTLDVNFPAHNDAPALMGLWARRKVDDLTSANWLCQITGDDPRTLKTNEIIDTALEFGIMTEYTSFVAVEPRVVNVGGKVRTVHVPVEMADGVSYQAIDKDSFLYTRGTIYAGTTPGTFAAPASKSANQAFGRGRAGGAGGGLGGGGGFRGGISDESLAGGGPKPLTEAEQAKLNYETKVSEKLRKAKGKVDVTIYLDDMSDALVKQIEALGIKVDVRDAKMKLLMTECDASVLQKLAQVKGVARVEPLE